MLYSTLCTESITNRKYVTSIMVNKPVLPKDVDEIITNI